MRGKYDPQPPRTDLAPLRPNKRRREEIAETNAELLQRDDRPSNAVPEEEEKEESEIPEDGEIDNVQNPVDTEENSVIMRRDNFPFVDLIEYHTEGKEVRYIQFNHIVNLKTVNRKITEDRIKKVEFDFMLNLKPLISKTATNPGMTRVRSSLKRPRYGPRRMQTGLREIIYSVGCDLCGRSEQFNSTCENNYWRCYISVLPE